MATTEDEPQPRTLDDISDDLGGITGELVNLRETYAKQTAVAERRYKSNRRMTKFALLATAVALVIAGYSVHLVTKANDDRHQRTIAACQQAQSAATTSITAGDAHDRIEADKLAPPPRNAFVQEKVDDYLEAQHANTVKQNRVRDCSALGIHDFYSTPVGPHAFLPPPPFTKPKG